MSDVYYDPELESYGECADLEHFQVEEVGGAVVQLALFDKYLQAMGDLDE